MVRKIDDLGRIVVPAETRRLFNIHEGDQLEITLEGDHIAVRARIPKVVAQFKVDLGIGENVTRQALCYPCTWNSAKRLISRAPSITSVSEGPVRMPIGIIPGPGRVRSSLTSTST